MKLKNAGFHSVSSKAQSFSVPQGLHTLGSCFGTVTGIRGTIF